MTPLPSAFPTLSHKPNSLCCIKSRVQRVGGAGPNEVSLRRPGQILGAGVLGARGARDPRAGGWCSRAGIPGGRGARGYWGCWECWGCWGPRCSGAGVLGPGCSGRRSGPRCSGQGCSGPDPQGPGCWADADADRPGYWPGRMVSGPECSAGRRGQSAGEPTAWGCRQCGIAYIRVSAMLHCRQCSPGCWGPRGREGHRGVRGCGDAGPRGRWTAGDAGPRGRRTAGNRDLRGDREPERPGEPGPGPIPQSTVDVGDLNMGAPGRGGGPPRKVADAASHAQVLA